MKTFYSIYPLHRLLLLLLAVFLANSAFAQPSFYGPYFTHDAAAETIGFNYTVLDHPDLNGNSNALIFATPNFSVNNEYADFRYGVWYDGLNWTIYNEDEESDFAEGTGWNVVYPQQNGTTFLHVATDDNITNNYTIIDHPSINMNPTARIIVTHNWIFGSNQVYNDQNIGVFYNNAQEKWAIYNEDTNADFPVDAAYNVFVPNPSEHVFVHTATVNNTTNDVTQMQHPMLNGNPDARFLITHNWNPNAEGTGVYDDAPNAVYFDGVFWNITNEDGAPVPAGAAYNVVVLTAGPGEYCGNPIALNCDFPELFTHNVGIPNDIEESGADACVEIGSGGQRWFYFNATFDGSVMLNTCGSLFDTQIHVFTGACGDLTCLESNDDSEECEDDLHSYVEFDVEEGMTYLVNVGGYDSQEGSFFLHIECVNSTGLAETGMDESWEVYPIPAGSQFTLNINSSELKARSLRVIDLQGRINLEHNLAEMTGSIVFPTDGLANGRYILQIVDDQGQTSTKPLIVVK